MSKISVIIPAYNEEEGIREIVDRVLKQTENLPLELIVINDGSTDATAEIVSKYKEQGVKLINHETNLGYGAALKTGFKSANGDLIAFLDADGTYPPEYLPHLCQTLIKENADIVLGSRFAGERTGMPRHRRFGNKILALFLSWIGNRKITDTASGMRVLKKSILPKLYPLPDGLEFTPAMSTRAIHEHLKVVEVPIPYSERMGRSKLSAIKQGYGFFRSITDITAMYDPLKFFGVFGLICLLVAFFLSIDPIFYYLNSRVVLETSIYRLLIVVILVLTGFNLISFGALSNYAVSSIHGIKTSYQIIYKRRFIAFAQIVGIILMFSGILSNLPLVVQYLKTSHIFYHWSYIVLGMLLFLCGLQIFILASLVRILEAITKKIKLNEIEERLLK